MSRAASSPGPAAIPVVQRCACQDEEIQRSPLTLPANAAWSRLAVGQAFPRAPVRVGAVDDPLEREAEHVAEAVVSSSPLPRLAAGVPAGRSPQRCACQDEETVQRSPLTGYFEPRTPAPPGITGAGRPLEPALREFMEPRFGVDLGAVRVHTGSEAAASARELNARAYTLGSHVVFGAEEYRPDTDSGRRLVAHELTHVLQQAGGRRGATAPVQRAAADEVGSDYDIDDTLRVLRQTLRVALFHVDHPKLPAERRTKIRNQFNKLLPVLTRLEQARDRDGRGVSFGFDPDPAKNEVIAGDSQKSLSELYAGFMAPPRPRRGPAVASTETSDLQAWALPGGLRISPAWAGEVQRCEFICIGVIVLAGLLLAGCRSERQEENRRTPCTTEERAAIETLHASGLTWVNTAVSRLAAYRDGSAGTDVRRWVEQALNANFHTTEATTVGQIATRLGQIQTRMAAEGAAGRYHCECTGPADAYTLGSGATAQIHVCRPWWQSSDRLRRITTLIHEHGHATGLEGSVPLSTGRIEDIYEFQGGYATMTPQQAIQNPDPFAVFARQLAHDGGEGPGTHR